MAEQVENRGEDEEEQLPPHHWEAAQEGGGEEDEIEEAAVEEVVGEERQDGDELKKCGSPFGSSAEDRIDPLSAALPGGDEFGAAGQAEPSSPAALLPTSPPTSSAEKRKREEDSLRYREKFREAMHLRHVRLYERAWEECLRREQLLARKPVEFAVQYNTSFGQELLLVGSIPELGEWDLDRSVPMRWTDGNIWTVKVNFPRQDALRIEYKYIVRDASSKVHWEGGNNHVLQAGRRDAWGGGG